LPSDFWERNVILQDVWDLISSNFFNEDFESNSRKGLFNLYHGAVSEFERPNADRIRQDNLHAYLESFKTLPRVLIVGEAPGWRGCRFSGVPFTSESQLFSASLPFQGQPTSLHQRPYSEATATVFWRVMAKYHPQFLVWNCVPFHAHRPGKPLSNRRPSNGEITRYLPLLARLISLLQPDRVIAVGRCAERTLNSIGIAALPVRHPSHGGAAVFEQGIHKIFN
jgi:uracil-DNA glycosylase